VRPTGPPRGLCAGQTTLATDRRGTPLARVGTRVGTSVGTRVGSRPPKLGRVRPPPGRRGRAAELASEAARAEGASTTLPPPVAGGRGAGQAVKREWLHRFDLRRGGEPDIRA
jgi:hypothetical protein